jgi:hypothetical protein
VPLLHIVFTIAFKLEYWKVNDATGVLTLTSVCQQPLGLTGDVGGDWAHEDTEQGQCDKHGAVWWTSATTHLFRIHAAFSTVACHITTRTPGLPLQPICRWSHCYAGAPRHRPRHDVSLTNNTDRSFDLKTNVFWLISLPGSTE